MNLVELQRRLLAAARSNPPTEQVPFGFEKLMVRRLTTHTVPDFCALWSQALWRASAPCAAIMLMLGTWCWLGQRPPPPAHDWSQEFDNTVLAAAESEQNYDFSW